MKKTEKKVSVAMVNSKQKGKKGEREWVNWLKDRGVDARRSQQYCGEAGDADVISDLPVHFEVKRVQHLQIEKAVRQAAEDSAATGLIPAVAHRKNRSEWLVTMRGEDWLPIVRLYQRFREGNNSGTPLDKGEEEREAREEYKAFR